LPSSLAATLPANTALEIMSVANTATTMLRPISVVIGFSSLFQGHDVMISRARFGDHVQPTH
jgi:hypothetical protein